MHEVNIGDNDTIIVELPKTGGTYTFQPKNSGDEEEDKEAGFEDPLAG